ncbi:MAG: class I SAM-dependent methyltransferase [Theionarchaea archaeon]|nr:class I SAM-dependent methyltransferase [Theionarchaea archaeon]
MKPMKNEFMSNEEYEKSFVDFWGIRSKIAHLLTDYGLKSGAHILDVPAGHGFLSCEIAKVIQRGSIHAVGLQNDLKTFQAFFRSLKGPEKEYSKLITYHVMDAAHLTFPDETFDFVVNFLGLEDINMTKGITGVKQCLSEFTRVLKPEGILQVTLCLEGDEPDQVIAKEIMEYIGCNAVFYSKDFYTAELQRRGIQILAEHWFHTRRKMTASQAREELLFACNETPKIFKDYDVHTVSFNKLWQKFGKRIKVHGMAFYSDLCVLIGQK